MKTMRQPVGKGQETKTTSQLHSRKRLAMNRIQQLKSALAHRMGPWLLGMLAFTILSTSGIGSCWANPPTINPSGAYIEAESFTVMGAPAPYAWEVRTSASPGYIAGANGNSYLYTTTGGTNAAPQGARVDYPVNFSASGTYQIWLRARDQAGVSGGDSTFWGVNGTMIGGLTQAGDDRWEWTTRLQLGFNTVNIPTAGVYTLNLWPREMGQHTDGFMIIRTDQTLPGNISEASTAGLPTGMTALVFSSAPAAGTITIPDGQSAKNISAAPNQIKLVGGAVTNPNELSYTTAETGLTWRALGRQSDGFSSLGSKWTKTDIGGDTTVAPSISGGELRLTGSGTNIWGTTDQFTYFYQPGISGDFTVDVQVRGMLTGTAAYAKAGVMVRQSLAANSPHATALLTRSNGAGFYRRVTSGGSSTNTLSGAGNLAPEWVRISRVGDTFTALHSQDGLTWTSIGSQAIIMTSPVIVGLAVTSANTAEDNTTQFDNFMFMPAGVTGMTTAWTNVASNIGTTGWTDGTYGVALRSSAAAYDTNTFSYSSCADATPSAITIAAGQTVKGSAVSLPALFIHTGNVANYTYQINGATVANPWNSLLFGTVTPQVVSLKVSGVDPDCGGTTISATQNITVDNTCSDATPSTLTIATGQSTGGPSVDLTKLYGKTGNVGSLTYTINGAPVTSPWNSTSFGVGSPVGVTFEVRGTDPDCGGSVVLATNTIEVNNTCVLNPPSLSFDKDLNYVGAGRAIPYVVTIRNENSLNCAPSVLTVSMLSDSNLVDFDPSYFSSGAGFTIAGDRKSATINLAGRVSATISLAVTAKVGATEWNSNNTSVRVSSASGQNTKSLTTGVFLVSPITHNSITTGSTKWGGNWGTSKVGSRYGNFDCLICHVKDGSNIKWMRSEIRLPGANWGTGTTTADLPILFQDARDGSPDWGNDDHTIADGYDPAPPGIGRSGSNKACEVCHTTTMYHRYNTEADPDGAGPLTKQTVYDHFPNRDCTDCHRHSLGFTASCDGCHGNPPLDATLGGPSGLANIPSTTGSTTPGTHYKHVVVLEYPCSYCHANYRNPGEMPKLAGNGKYDINHTFKVFDSNLPAASAGHYTGQDGVSYEGTIVQRGQGTLTCENIYCHGGTDNMGGTNPQWNGNISCNSCHGTSATNTPPGYSHTTHVGKMGLACTLCHGASTGLGANGHVNGSVHIDLSGLSTKNSPNATYSGVGGTAGGSPLGKIWDSGKLAPSASYGTCSNVACHYNKVTPVWNNNNQPATCTTCHNNGTNSGLLVNAAPNTGAHAKHVNPAPGVDTLMINGFVNKCESCHGAGANTASHGGHANFATNFAANMTWSAPNCTNACHGPSNLNNWNAVGHLACQACHAAPYIGPTVVFPSGSGAPDAANGNSYGSHLKATKTESLSGATNWDSQCKKCHGYHDGVEVPLPPTNWTAATGTSSPRMGRNMQEQLGLQYPITGAIHLGGTATSGATEAEICWNCHGTDTEINEWGYNGDTNGASFPATAIAPDITTPAGHTYWAGPAGKSYNYGYLYTTFNRTTNVFGTATARWVDVNGKGMFRRDAYQHSTETNPDYILSQRISSVHSVNFMLTQAQGSSVANNIDGSGNVIRSDSQVLETSGQIRCSYCHDVHDLNRALVDINAGTPETATGQPFLRGSWFGNPYAPDLPPLNSYSYPTTGGANSYGQRFWEGSTTISFPVGNAVPRLFANKDIQAKGGYFIDQNSDWPATGKAANLSDTAGICVLCHGNDVNTMNYYSASMWRSDQVNGHANAVLGGSGATHANARNIFDGRRGTTAATGLYMAGQDGINVADWGNNTSLKGSGPYRTTFNEAAKTAANSPPRNTGWYGGTEGSTTRGAQYATWYSGNTTLTHAASIGTNGTTARAHDFTCSKCHSPHATGLPALLITNCLDFRVSNWTRTADNSVVKGPTTANAFALRSQNNCHRKEGTGTGWHRLNIAQ